MIWCLFIMKHDVLSAQSCRCVICQNRPSTPRSLIIQMESKGSWVPLNKAYNTHIDYHHYFIHHRRIWHRFIPLTQLKKRIPIVGKTCIIYSIQHEKIKGNKDNVSKITLIMTQSEQFIQKTYYVTGEISKFKVQYTKP